MRTISLVASALCLVTLGASAQTAGDAARRYEGVTAGSGGLLWRIDTKTGQVSACTPVAGQSGLSVRCSQWGDETTYRPAPSGPNGVLSFDDVPEAKGALPKE